MTWAFTLCNATQQLNTMILKAENWGKPRPCARDRESEQIVREVAEGVLPCATPKEVLAVATEIRTGLYLLQP